MTSLGEYGRTARTLHRIGLQQVWCPKYRRPALEGRVGDRLPHLRSRLLTQWSKSYTATSVGRVPQATIRRYIAEQTTRPQKGRP